MNRQWEANFFSEGDLRERMVVFTASNGSLDIAADLGLLALSVPTRFGGLFVDRDTRGLVNRLLTNELLYIISSHQLVCDEIYMHGTYAQYDVHLPRLAAGKRIGIRASLVMDPSLQSSLCAEKCEDGFLFTGNTVARGSVNDCSLVSMTAMLERRVRSFIVEGSLLPKGHKVKRGWILYELRQHFIGQNTLLGGLLPSAPPSNEKWEAIRWRTDQSVS